MAYVATRAQLDLAAGVTKSSIKPTSVAGCSYEFTLDQIMNSTENAAHSIQENSFHHLSYLYFMPLGAIVTIFSAFLLSFCFGFEDSRSVDARLFAPFIRKYLRCDKSPQKETNGYELTFNFIAETEEPKKLKQ